MVAFVLKKKVRFINIHKGSGRVCLTDIMDKVDKTSLPTNRLPTAIQMVKANIYLKKKLKKDEKIN